jgi:hypothetical protein
MLSTDFSSYSLSIKVYLFNLFYYVTCSYVNADCVWMFLQSLWFQKHGRQKNSTRESGPDPIMSWWNCWWRVKPYYMMFWRVLFVFFVLCILLLFCSSEITWPASCLCFIFGVCVCVGGGGGHGKRILLGLCFINGFLRWVWWYVPQPCF